MPRKGRKLEQLVAMFEETLGPQGVKVTSPDYIIGRMSGSSREIDISLRSRIGSSEILVIIECRDRKDTENVNWIEELATKCEDVGANKAVVVSSTGFSSGALGLANKKSIELRTYEEVNPNEIMLWFGFEYLIVYNKKSDIKNVDVNLVDSGESSIEIPEDLISKIYPIFDINAKIFVSKKDGKLASFSDIWMANDMETLYSNVEPDGEKIKYKVKLRYPNENDRFQLKITKGYRDIDFFIVECELWVETEKRPLNSVRAYKNEDKIIAQSAEFTFENRGKQFSLELHKIEETGYQLITVVRRNNI